MRVSPEKNIVLIPLDQLEKRVRFLRLLANPHRARILDFLDTVGSPQCVNKIVEVCEGEAQAIVSQQLRILKDGKLLDAERVGNRIFYRIVSPEVRRYLTALRKCCV
jgi:ArsR family transcriptional regulator, lead/cadmium/zinc/bismuth-responsive transcriptional repressor